MCKIIRLKKCIFDCMNCSSENSVIITLPIKMKYYLLIILCIFLLGSSFSQNCDEFKTHQKSIENVFYPGHILDGKDSVFNANTAFVNYTIEHNLQKESDKCFVSNRNLLKKLNTILCNDSTIIIRDQLTNGEQCVITLETNRFNVNQHYIISNKDTSAIESIDGSVPYGGCYALPIIEVGDIEILINGLELKVPRKAYSNLYEPNMCSNFRFYREIEVYESLDGQYIYLYIYGGHEAGTYFSKLIFDKTKFITKIVSDYYSLSIHSSFRIGFIGY